MNTLYTKKDKLYTVRNGLGHTNVLYRMEITCQGVLQMVPVFQEPEDEAQYLIDLTHLKLDTYDYHFKDRSDLPRSQSGLL
jgi:hypothetical protein